MTTVSTVADYVGRLGSMQKKLVTRAEARSRELAMGQKGKWAVVVVVVDVCKACRVDVASLWWRACSMYDRKRMGEAGMA